MILSCHSRLLGLQTQDLLLAIGGVMDVNMPVVHTHKEKTKASPPAVHKPCLCLNASVGQSAQTSVCPKFTFSIKEMKITCLPF